MKHLMPFLLIFLAACATAQAPEPATDTSLPTQTSTPLPTATPSPTSTPVPTQSTQPEVNRDPDPIMVFTGTGNAKKDVELPADFVGIIHVIGNAAGEPFSVENYNLDGEKIGFLVNTTEPYDGLRPLDFLIDEDTGSFKITAQGEWTIEVIDIFDAPFLDLPGTLSESGDYVVILGGGLPEGGYVKANESGNSFRIIGYGNGIDLLVDSPDPVETTFPIDQDIVVLEIQAVGDWTIDVDGQ